jgi:hypothetical protein
VKDLAENKITKLKQAAESMHDKISAYRQLDTNLHVLMDLDFKEIINALPKMKPNVVDVFHLFVAAYGEKAVLPIVGKTFGIQLGADKGALVNQIKLLEVNAQT